MECGVQRFRGQVICSICISDCSLRRTSWNLRACTILLVRCRRLIRLIVTTPLAPTLVERQVIVLIIIKILLVQGKRSPLDEREPDDLLLSLVPAFLYVLADDRPVKP